MKTKHLAGVAIIALCVATGVFALSSSLTPYMSFDSARESARRVQIAGSLVKDSIDFNTETGTYSFTVEDTHANTMRVKTSAELPAGFEQSGVLVAVGVFDGTAFEAQRILVKCPSKYDSKNKDITKTGENF